jgi:hypothetical protein
MNILIRDISALISVTTFVASIGVIAEVMRQLV